MDSATSDRFRSAFSLADARRNGSCGNYQKKTGLDTRAAGLGGRRPVGLGIRTCASIGIRRCASIRTGPCACSARRNTRATYSRGPPRHRHTRSSTKVEPGIAVLSVCSRQGRTRVSQRRIDRALGWRQTCRVSRRTRQMDGHLETSIAVPHVLPFLLPFAPAINPQLTTRSFSTLRKLKFNP